MALSADQLEFLDWLIDDRPANSKDGGKGTQNQWCREKGLLQGTVSGWRQQDSFKKEYLRRLDEIGISDTIVAEMRNALLGKALTGDVKAIEKWMDLVKLIQPDFFDRSTNTSDPTQPQAEKPIEQMTAVELADFLK